MSFGLDLGKVVDRAIAPENSKIAVPVLGGNLIIEPAVLHRNLKGITVDLYQIGEKIFEPGERVRLASVTLTYHDGGKTDFDGLDFRFEPAERSGEQPVAAVTNSGLTLFDAKAHHSTQAQPDTITGSSDLANANNSNLSTVSIEDTGSNINSSDTIVNNSGRLDLAI